MIIESSRADTKYYKYAGHFTIPRPYKAKYQENISYMLDMYCEICTFAP
jgi:hypothetical protein